jgi:hypothetical protein
MIGAPARHALLIGVDFYIPGQLADGSFYPSLRGSVRDINHVQTFLQTELMIPDERIVKLTSTNTGTSGQQQPPEAPEFWPTYPNMKAAFERITTTAVRGDHVYVHYSGHGGRTPTLVKDIKGANGEDESLVPMDIHRSDAQYLRDIELGVILKRMVEKGIQLTVVFDSCHSGGAVRGPVDAAVRGINVLDATPRPTNSLVASIAELADTWRSMTGTTARNIVSGSGWLPETEGYVFMAACRPSESAYEFAFDGQKRNGALTYWLLDTLRSFGTGLSWRAVHDRIVAKVHTQFVLQTPQLQGEGHLTFLGSQLPPPKPTVPVLQTDPKRNWVQLAAGQAVGVGRGAQFAVYPMGTLDFGARAKRRGVVTIRELGATSSWAEVTERATADPIETGAHAVLINPGASRLVRGVQLARASDLESGVNLDRAERALSEVARLLEANAWVGLAGAEDAVDLQVAVNAKGQYEIWDGVGSPLPNLQPAISVEEQDAATRVVKRLEHLARYRSVEQLDNYDPLSPLAGKLSVELVGVQDEYVAGDKPRPRAWTDPGATPHISVGQTTFLKITNQSTTSLNIGVLDLQPDWGISLVYPPGTGDSFVQLDAGKELLPLIPLRAWLPAGYVAGRDLMKVVAAVGPIEFRLLELPALGQAPISRRTERRRNLANDLETLMNTITSEAPRTRNVTTPANPSVEWTSASVELRVRAGH